MSESPSEFFARWARAISTQDFAALEQMIDPDFVGEYPQSGERFVGFKALRSQLERYPGGLGRGDLAPSKAKVIGAEERWAITPGYTVLPLAGPERYTTIARATYPDGSMWWIVSVIQLRNDRVWRAETYFAPDFEAPEWRRDIAERYDPDA